MRRYVDTIFSDAYLTTVGVKIDKKVLTVGTEQLALILWDIAGEDEVSAVRVSYLRGAAGYLLVVDGTRPETLETAASIQTRVNAEVGGVPFLVLLNKADLQEDWAFPRRAARGAGGCGLDLSPHQRQDRRGGRGELPGTGGARSRDSHAGPAGADFRLAPAAGPCAARSRAPGRRWLAEAGAVPADTWRTMAWPASSPATPPATRLPFLEGLLPLAETPFLIRSMEMPSGRVADVHFFADDSTVWMLLLDVTAEYEEARLVQQKAYDMTLLSQREARLIAQLESANRELTRAHRELAASREALQRTHDRLQQELREAERYVRAILPAPLSEPLAVDWRFVPSTELGGDSFGYHWVDDEHFALYLIDVCGHGVGAALLSVAVADTLRSEALPRTDFRSPAEVLTALNQAYQMERHGELFCTVWYGVYHRATGSLAIRQPADKT